MRAADATGIKLDRRLDQWLWFARLAKSRSLAARLCEIGAVIVNGKVAGKASQVIRIGDAVIVPQGRLRRRVRVLALGTRRGPTAEARLLYEETAPPDAMPEPAIPWLPLLVDDAQSECGDGAAG